jgi:hypothetical protein
LGGLKLSSSTSLYCEGDVPECTNERRGDGNRMPYLPPSMPRETLRLLRRLLRRDYRYQCWDRHGDGYLLVERRELCRSFSLRATAAAAATFWKPTWTDAYRIRKQDHVVSMPLFTLPSTSTTTACTARRDAEFIRLSTLSLAYTIPTNVKFFSAPSTFEIAISAFRRPSSSSGGDYTAAILESTWSFEASIRRYDSPRCWTTEASLDTTTALPILSTTILWLLRSAGTTDRLR